MDTTRFVHDLAERSDWTARFEDRLWHLRPTMSLVKLIAVAAEQYALKDDLVEPEEAAESYYDSSSIDLIL